MVQLIRPLLAVSSLNPAIQNDRVPRYSHVKSNKVPSIKVVAALTIQPQGMRPMIDFIYNLNEQLPSWTEKHAHTIEEIALATSTSIPHVIQYLSEGLGKDVELSQSITTEEAQRVLEALALSNRPLMEERERLLALRRQNAVAAFERSLEKSIEMQAARNWHGAYRSLHYLAGQYEKDLPVDLLVTTLSEAIRCGIKAQTNIQELGQLLQKAVGYAMGTRSRQGVEDALDLVDAYGEFFFQENTGRGPLLLGNILAVVEEPAARYELWDTYKRLVDRLYPL